MLSWLPPIISMIQAKVLLSGETAPLSNRIWVTATQRDSPWLTIRRFLELILILLCWVTSTGSVVAQNVIAWGISAATTNVPPDATNVIALSAGRDFTLALRSDGTIVAWGLA